MPEEVLEAPAPAAAPAAAPEPASAPAPAQTLLSAGATGSPPAPAPAAPEPHAWAPEKHRVFAADGSTLDVEATARKVADAYRAAEKRIGSGDIPPADAKDYKVTVPESLAGKVDAAELAKAPDFQAFLGQMHGLGLTQKQLDGVSAVLLERGAAMREAAPALAAAEAEAQLRQADGWKTDAEYQARIRSAFTAGKRYGGGDFEAILQRYGNDPAIVRMLANVGAELQEDEPASAEAQAQLADNLETMMMSKAYLNSHDPMHAATVAKVTALQARIAGTKPAGPNRTFTFKSG